MLALDFAVLVSIIGGWVVFVLGSPNAVFADLAQEQNLKKLALAVVMWVVLYAQHVRVTGSLEPPDPPLLSAEEHAP